MKTFKEYHDTVNPLADYPDIGNNMVYPALGLAGESGEAADKVKKLWRNHLIMGLEEDDIAPCDLSKVADFRVSLIKELGDCLWYLDALATELKTTLEEVAARNVDKLLDRHSRGVIKSEGDNR